MKSSSCFVVIAIGCASTPPPVEEPVPDPERTGTSSIIDFQPKNSPTLSGNYDFELLEQVQGTRCLRRSELAGVRYWLMFSGIEKVSSDGLTRQVVAAAAHDALSHIEEDVDTIVVTRVVATGSGPDKVCATVFGRGIRMIKKETATEAE